MLTRSVSGKKRTVADVEAEGTPNIAANVSDELVSTARKRSKKDENDKPRNAKIEPTDDTNNSMTNTAAPVERLFHPRYSNTDGSIVLVIGEIHFRLSRSSLERKSPWLQYMFKMYLNTPRDTLPDGCPVVKLGLGFDFSVDDFAAFLDATEDVTLLIRQPPFETTAAVLRVSTVLKVSGFREWAIKSLESLWPDDPAAVTAAYKPHAAETLALARSCNVPSVIRPVMYELARSENVAEALSKRAKNQKGADPDATKQPLLLCEEDIQTVQHLRTCLAERWFRQTMQGTSANHHCGCIASGTKWRILHESGLMKACLYDPILGLGLLAGQLPPDAGPPKQSASVPSNNGGKPADRSENELRRMPIQWAQHTAHAKCYLEITRSFHVRKQVIWKYVNVLIANSVN